MMEDRLRWFWENPFRILEAKSSDPRGVLIRHQEDLSLFEAEAASDALNALLHPYSRLEAELRWFPQMKEEEVRELEAFLKEQQPKGEALRAKGLPSPAPLYQGGSFLAQFNVLRLSLATLQPQTYEGWRSLFLALAVAGDALLPEQVQEEINEDRRAANFTLVTDLEEVNQGIRDLFLETIQTQIQGVPVSRWPGLMAREYERAYTDRESPFHNSLFLELAARELGISTERFW